MVGKAVQIRRGYGESESRGVSRNKGRNTGSSVGTSRAANDQWSVTSSFNSGNSWGKGDNAGYSELENFNEVVDYVIQPAAFARGLRKGGAANGGFIDAIMVQGGRRFRATDAHWVPCIFKQ